MDRLRDADTTLVVPNPFDIPPPGSIHDKPGFFIDCDLEAGFLGTPLRAYWANMITECIRNAILKAGMAPEYTDWTQLGVAIEKIAEKLIEEALDEFEFVQEGGNVSGTIKNRKFTLNAPALPASLTRIGGNVTGSISIADGTFALDAPAGPDLPDVLVQDGGNVTGTISIADGKFTLNADAGDGGGGVDLPPIADRSVVIGTGTSIRAATDGGRSAAWSASGRLGVHDGSVGASGGSDGACLFGGTLIDGSQAANFSHCLDLTISQPAIAGKNWISCTTEVGTKRFGVTLDGTVSATNTSIQAADYAEWFEAAGALEIGLSIVIDSASGLVRPFDAATDVLDDIIGVTRPRNTPDAMIGNAAESIWAGAFLKDPFGAPVFTDFTDADGQTYQVPAQNRAYDPARPYIPRSRRPEWNLIGLLGQVPVLTGQPLNPRWRAIRPLIDSATLVYIR